MFLCICSFHGQYAHQCTLIIFWIVCQNFMQEDDVLLETTRAKCISLDLLFSLVQICPLISLNLYYFFCWQFQMFLKGMESWQSVFLGRMFEDSLTPFLGSQNIFKLLLSTLLQCCKLLLDNCLKDTLMKIVFSALSKFVLDFSNICDIHCSHLTFFIDCVRVCFFFLLL